MLEFVITAVNLMVDKQLTQPYNKYSIFVVMYQGKDDMMTTNIQYSLSFTKKKIKG